MTVIVTLRRLVAITVDWFIAWGIVMLITLLLHSVGAVRANFDGAGSNVVEQSLWLLTIVGMLTLSMVASDGQTLGKKLMRLRVESDGNPLRLALREVIIFLPFALIVLQPVLWPLILIPMVSLGMSLARGDWSVQDIICKTRVVALPPRDTGA